MSDGDLDATLMHTRQVRRVPSAEDARPRTTVTTSSTRIAYDPGAQGITAAHYPVRRESQVIPPQHDDVAPPVATAKRTTQMAQIQARLRRQLLAVMLGVVAVTAGAVAALVALIGGS